MGGNKQNNLERYCQMKLDLSWNYLSFIIIMCDLFKNFDELFTYDNAKVE